MPYPLHKSYSTDYPKENNALYRSGTGDGTAENAGYNNGDTLYFDASRSSSIYGKSKTVQPPALILIPQLKY